MCGWGLVGYLELFDLQNLIPCLAFCANCEARNRSALLSQLLPEVVVFILIIDGYAGGLSLVCVKEPDVNDFFGAFTSIVSVHFD